MISLEIHPNLEAVVTPPKKMGFSHQEGVIPPPKEAEPPGPRSAIAGLAGGHQLQGRQAQLQEAAVLRQELQQRGLAADGSGSGGERKRRRFQRTIGMAWRGGRRVAGRG